MTNKKLMTNIDEKWAGTYFLDENKNAIPCNTTKWVNQQREMRINNTRHVAITEIDNKWISTVWIGLDQGGFYSKNKPLLLETMVFNKNGNYHELYCDRYPTWHEAIKGHERAVNWVKNGCKDND